MLACKTEAFASFGKEIQTVATKLTIGLIGVMAMILLFAGSISGEKMWPSEGQEQIIQEKETVRFKCDPCDYNIDYGDTHHLGEKAGLDEQYVTLECDPCDYNIDHGGYLPTEK